MVKASLNRQIGSIFMIIGTEVGAGVLALPIIISRMGILYGSLIIVVAWLIMLYTALLVCEANYNLPLGSSFASMAYKFIGLKGKWILTIIFGVTLYSILMAYISAAGSVVNSIIDVPNSLASLLFVVILGLVVISGTRAVDYLNRTLMSIKLFAFLTAIVLMFFTIKIHNLFNIDQQQNNLVFISIPAIITSFILHNIIPTIRNYLSNNLVQLRKVVIIGSIIPLVLYLIWVWVILGNIPTYGAYSFHSLHKLGSDANIGDLISILAFNVKYPIIISSINFVSTISVTTSFLGVAISLYEFIKDLVNSSVKQPHQYRMLPIFLTFIIPLLIVQFYPNLFILALNFAGLGASILFILIPVIIMKQMLRNNYACDLPILTKQSLLNLIFIVGVAVIAIECFNF